MYDRIAVKEHAKARMQVSDPRCWKLMLLWAAAAVLLPSVVETLTGSVWNDVYSMVMSGIDYSIIISLVGSSYLLALALSLIITLYQTVMDFGVAVYALKLHRGEECAAADLFSGFAMIGRVLWARILVGLRVMGLGLLGGIVVGLCAGVISWISQLLGGILMVLGWLAVLAAVIVLALNYALTDLVLADCPELRAAEAVSRSAQLMRGNKGRFVVLCLSFAGWYILCGVLYGAFSGLLSLGLVPLPDLVSTAVAFACMLPIYLWLNPYVAVSEAAFYDEMRKEQTAQQALPFEPLDEFQDL